MGGRPNGSTVLADRRLPGMNEVQEDRWRRRQATRYLSEHPSEWPRLFGDQAPGLVEPGDHADGSAAHARDAGGAVLLYETPAFRAARTLHLITSGRYGIRQRSDCSGPGGIERP